MATSEDRLAELEERLRELELERDAGRDRNPFRVIRDLRNELIPTDVRRHMLAARRENLLAMRSYLDRAIGRLETAASHLPSAGGDASDTTV